MKKGSQRIHLIAIGGSAMHNLALELAFRGHHVTGSDDEIYNPSKQRLSEADLLPEEFGWFPQKIHDRLDCVILGMHARSDNPELLKAQELNIPIYSYPEFVYQQSKNKKRIVIAGSHGKTTTTSMILHVLSKLNKDFDYLVGAQISGFERMVKLSDAPIIVIEGDEYLSSPIDRRPKMLHYKADIAVITGIEWDHINVFKSFDIYKEQFRLFIESMNENSTLNVFEGDEHIRSILKEKPRDNLNLYSGLASNGKDAVLYQNEAYPIQVFGAHNRQNMEAAMLCCQQIGIDNETFLRQIADFSGAAKRLQSIPNIGQAQIYSDFAHAPSKVRATVKAIREKHPNKTVSAFLELHTFSSLNKDFIPLYKDSMQLADEAIVYYSPHTLAMKKMPDLEIDFVHQHFNHPNLKVFSQAEKVHDYLKFIQDKDQIILLMSSGNFGGLNLTIFQ